MKHSRTPPKAQSFGFTEARYRSIKYLPYTYSHVASLIPTERPGLGTFAVDEHMRILYDPAVFGKWSIDECTLAIDHEDFHVLFRHHARARECLGPQATEADYDLWNQAADCCVNETLKQGGLPVPDDWLLPEWLSLPPNKSVEEYWSILKERQEDQPPQSGDGAPSDGDGGSSSGEPQDSDGEGDDSQDSPGGMPPGEPYEGEGPDIGKGGGTSASDGRPKPWDCPPPEDSGVPGMDEFNQQMLERDVAQKMEQWAKSQGTLPGRLGRWVESILRPKVDPFKRLRAAVRASVTTTRGLGDYTFRRESRRQPAGGLRLPAAVQPVPRVTLIVDTSGSMSGTELAKALGVVQQALQSVPGDRIRVISGDTCSQKVQNVFKAQDVELLGGGGTDMGAIVVEACKERPAPDAVVVVTDGWTPWPGKQVRPKVVVCLTEESQAENVPKWMDKVVLHD